MGTSRITKTQVQPAAGVDQDTHGARITKVQVQPLGTTNQDTHGSRVSKIQVQPAASFAQDTHGSRISKIQVQVLCRYTEGVWVPSHINNTGMYVDDQKYRFDGLNVLTFDPYFQQVTMLLHANGTNGSTAFVDTVGNTTFSLSASAQLSTAEKKFGTASFVFNATTAYEFNCTNSGLNATGDYTFEFWVYRRNTSGGTVFCKTDGSFYWNLGEGVIRPTSGTTVTTGTISNNVWHHVAISRTGTAVRVFLDGALLNTVTAAGTINYNNLGFGKFYPNANLPWDGYIDDIRFTNGVGRYTAAFAVPIFEFPDHA